MNSWISSKVQTLSTASSYSKKTEDHNHMWCHRVQINQLQLSALVNSDQTVWTSTCIPNRYYRIHSELIQASVCLLPIAEHRNLIVFYTLNNTPPRFLWKIILSH